MKLKKEKFGEVQELKYGKALKASDRQSGKFPVYGSNGIIGYHNTPLVNTSGIVLGRKGSFGKVHFVEQPFWPIDTTYYIESSKEFDLKYLFYLLKSMRLDSVNLHVAVPGLSRSDVYKRRISYPEDVTDQKRIAKVLSDCEQLIAWRKESIQLLDDYLESVFLEMFGDPATNPQKWNESTLDKVCLKITDGTHHSPPIQENGIPYITAKHIKENKVDFFSNPWYISERDHRAIYSRCNPEKGDVLYIKDGATTGKSAINPYDFEFSLLSSVALLKVNKEVVLAEFLNSWLNNSFVKQRIIAKMAGGAIKRLTLTKIKKLKILVPPIDLQSRFTEAITKVKGVKNDCLTSLKELEYLYASLSQKAFKGELDFSKVIVDEEVVPAQSPEETTKVSTEKAEHLNLKKAATKRKGKRDIRNLTLLDHLGVPAELYVDKIADDYGPELDFIGDDLFYQFYLKDNFADQAFTFSDLHQKFNNYYIPKGQDFEPRTWKSILYKFMEANKPLVEQIFDETSGTIKLKLTDEAFKA